MLCLIKVNLGFRSGSILLLLLVVLSWMGCKEIPVAPPPLLPPSLEFIHPKSEASYPCDFEDYSSCSLSVALQYHNEWKVEGKTKDSIRVFLGYKLIADVSKDTSDWSWEIIRVLYPQGKQLLLKDIRLRSSENKKIEDHTRFLLRAVAATNVGRSKQLMQQGGDASVQGDEAVSDSMWVSIARPEQMVFIARNDSNVVFRGTSAKAEVSLQGEVDSLLIKGNFYLTLFYHIPQDGGWRRGNQVRLSDRNWKLTDALSPNNRSFLFGDSLYLLVQAVRDIHLASLGSNPYQTTVPHFNSNLIESKPEVPGEVLIMSIAPVNGNFQLDSAQLKISGELKKFAAQQKVEVYLVYKIGQKNSNWSFTPTDKAIRISSTGWTGTITVSKGAGSLLFNREEITMGAIATSSLPSSSDPSQIQLGWSATKDTVIEGRPLSRFSLPNDLKKPKHILPVLSDTKNETFVISQAEASDRKINLFNITDDGARRFRAIKFNSANASNPKTMNHFAVNSAGSFAFVCTSFPAIDPFFVSVDLSGFGDNVFEKKHQLKKNREPVRVALDETNNVAYAITSNESAVHIFSIVQPAMPVGLDSLQLGSNLTDIIVEGGIAYISDSGASRPALYRIRKDGNSSRYYADTLSNQSIAGKLALGRLGGREKPHLFVATNSGQLFPVNLDDIDDELPSVQFQGQPISLIFSHSLDIVVMLSKRNSDFFLNAFDATEGLPLLREYALEKSYNYVDMTIHPDSPYVFVLRTDSTVGEVLRFDLNVFQSKY